MNLNFVIIPLVDSDFVSETFEDVDILLWLLDHLDSLSPHRIHCLEHVKMFLAGNNHRHEV